MQIFTVAHAALKREILSNPCITEDPVQFADDINNYTTLNLQSFLHSKISGRKCDEGFSLVLFTTQ